MSLSVKLSTITKNFGKIKYRICQSEVFILRNLVLKIYHNFPGFFGPQSHPVPIGVKFSVEEVTHWCSISPLWGKNLKIVPLNRTKYCH